MFDLDAQTLVITGAAGGLGSAMAEMFVGLGATVALTDLESSDGAEEAEALNGAHFFAMDVTDKADTERAAREIVERLGPVTGVVANAGIAPTAPSLDYALDTWNKVIAINQTGVFLTAQTFGRLMVENAQAENAFGISGRGAMVLTSSIAGLAVVHPERHVAYGASKAAVAHMAALLGVEWARKGIRVNAIAPGYIDTPILDKMKEEDPETVAEWKAAIPIGRLLDPREVAAACAFLLSPAASAITGTVLSCDGGYAAA